MLHELLLLYWRYVIAKGNKNYCLTVTFKPRGNSFSCHTLWNIIHNRYHRGLFCYDTKKRGVDWFRNFVMFQFVFAEKLCCWKASVIRNKVLLVFVDIKSILQTKKKEKEKINEIALQKYAIKSSSKHTHIVYVRTISFSHKTVKVTIVL